MLTVIKTEADGVQRHSLLIANKSFDAYGFKQDDNSDKQLKNTRKEIRSLTSFHFSISLRFSDLLANDQVQV